MSNFWCLSFLSPYGNGRYLYPSGMRLTIEVWKLLVIAFGNISRPVVNGRSVTVQRDTDTVEIWKNLNDLCGIAFVPGWSSDLGAQAVSTLYSVYKNPLQVHPWNTLANLASHYTTRKCLPMTWLLVRHLYLILFHTCHYYTAVCPQPAPSHLIWFRPRISVLPYKTSKCPPTSHIT